jgi:sarcosine oxidase
MSALLDQQHIDHEVLGDEEATGRWPGMRFEGSVLHQPGGGALDADRAGATLRRLAVSRGARMIEGQPVRRIRILDDGRVSAELDDRTLEARAAVVTVGPWAPRLLSGLVDLPKITVTQEQPRFFAPVDPAQPWPSFVHWRQEAGRWGRYESYGLYEPGSGVKVGLHGSGPVVDPDTRDFAVDPDLDEALHAYVRRWFPGLDAERSTAISCLYDNTDAEEFIIDRVGPVTFATGFHGEGFKFVPAIGQLLRDLAVGRVQTPSRFSVAGHAGALTGRSR